MIPEFTARLRASIDEDAAQAFRGSGVLVLRGVLHPDELAALQDATMPLVERASAGRVDDPDYFYGDHGGVLTARRIEYVIDKLPACEALLGHPFILRTVEILQGRNFVPTWDSCVFKLPGAGVAVPWHNDGAVYDGLDIPPVFNVDFYLDEADLTNCVWAVPGSHLWPREKTSDAIASLNSGGFSTEGAFPVLMRPGDVLLHHVSVLHGSDAAQSGLRRVLYYEFRPGEVEREHGPHVPSYIGLKQQVLLECLRRRADAAYAAGEEPFTYRPGDGFAVPDGTPSTMRFAHQEFWRES